MTVWFVIVVALVIIAVLAMNIHQHIQDLAREKRALEVLTRETAALRVLQFEQTRRVQDARAVRQSAPPRSVAHNSHGNGFAHDVDYSPMADMILTLSTPMEAPSVDTPSAPSDFSSGFDGGESGGGGASGSFD